MSNLKDLIARVEKATGPDPQLDLHVHQFLQEDWMHGTMPFYTSSLDAVVALVEMELPDWRWHVAKRGYDNGAYQDGKAGAWLDSPFSSGFGMNAKAFAPTPALALLLVFLRAKESQS